MKVLLINPPFRRLMGIKFNYFPLGLGYLAGTLSKEGFDVKIYNVENPKEVLPTGGTEYYRTVLNNHSKLSEALDDDNHPVWQEVASTLREFTPQVVGITVMTAKYPAALKIARLVKKVQGGGCKVVMGGPHATISAAEVLENDCVDFTIRGEGEATFLELCRNLEEGKDYKGISGLSFRDNGSVVHNQDRMLLADLDKLPFPLKEASINYDLYEPTNLGYVMTSRGCPYGCKYCGSANIWTRRVRKRSVASAISEIRYIRDNYKSHHVAFCDDTFNIDHNYLRELCEGIIQERLNVTWYCDARADRINEETVRLMKRAGCVSMSIGVETGSERIMKYIHKGVSLESIENAFEVLKRHNINTTAYFMVGFPDETEEDIQATLNFMQKLRPSRITLSIFTPYPGTELFERGKELGLISEKPDWSLFSHQSPNNHFIKNLSKERFREWVDRLARFADENNNSFRSRLESQVAQAGYYISNPKVFLKKLAKYALSS